MILKNNLHRNRENGEEVEEQAIGKVCKERHNHKGKHTPNYRQNPEDMG